MPDQPDAMIRDRAGFVWPVQWRALPYRRAHLYHADSGYHMGCTGNDEMRPTMAQYGNQSPIDIRMGARPVCTPHPPTDAHKATANHYVPRCKRCERWLAARRLA